MNIRPELKQFAREMRTLTLPNTPNKVLARYEKQIRNKVAKNAVALFMKALGKQKLSEATWIKIADANKIILD